MSGERSAHLLGPGVEQRDEILDRSRTVPRDRSTLGYPIGRRSKPHPLILVGWITRGSRRASGLPKADMDSPYTARTSVGRNREHYAGIVAGRYLGGKAAKYA